MYLPGNVPNTGNAEINKATSLTHARSLVLNVLHVYVLVVYAWVYRAGKETLTCNVMITANEKNKAVGEGEGVDI